LLARKRLLRYIIITTESLKCCSFLGDVELMNAKIAELARICLAGGQLERAQINVLLAESGKDFYDLFYWANRLRERFFGNSIRICSIVPGRLGGCSEDCKFCAQSVRYRAGYAKTEVISEQRILEAARQAREKGVRRFGIVSSGKSVSREEFERIERLAAKIRQLGLNVCASLGVIDDGQALRLRQAGVSEYNHNLETSARHFPQIVTTHRYADRVSTIQAAMKAGLRICAGGIFGIGETENDRIDMALELRKLDVETVPMNFLHPIPGTPLGQTQTLQPREILRIIALYRFILPRTNLKIAGGRVLNLRDMQSWMFYAGANALLSGNYLTTTGRAVEEDMQMLRDLGLEIQAD